MTYLPVKIRIGEMACAENMRDVPALCVMLTVTLLHVWDVGAKPIWR
jgi:hypothetical protein